MTPNSNLNVFRFPHRFRAMAHDAVRRSRVNPEQRLIRARAQAKQDAARLGHELRLFHEDPTSDAFVISTCEHCWAGCRIHVATGEISPADLLQLECRGRGIR